MAQLANAFYINYQISSRMPYILQNCSNSFFNKMKYLWQQLVKVSGDIQEKELRTSSTSTNWNNIRFHYVMVSTSDFDSDNLRFSVEPIKPRGLFFELSFPGNFCFFPKLSINIIAYRFFIPNLK